MRTLRLAACAAAVAATVLAPAATAAPACNLVVDPKGDAKINDDVPAGVYTSPDQDIVGADVASNKRQLTAVVRLVSLREVDTDAPTGRVYVVQLSVSKHPYSLIATYGPDGYQGSVYDLETGTGIGNAGVVLDHAAKQVRLSAPVGLFKAFKGATIHDIVVSSGHRYGTSAGKSVPTPLGYGAYVGGGGANSNVDTAQSARTYVAGSASCVAVGR